MAMHPVLLLLLTLPLVACERPDGQGDADAPDSVATGAPATNPPGAAGTTLQRGFDLERLESPSQLYALGDELDEISGLTIAPDGRLIAVHDEDDRLFAIDPSSGAVTESIDFGPTEDYESVEWVGDRLFVLRSNGDLYEIANWEGDPDVEEFEADVPGSCDAEGLAFDPARNRLLVSCKEGPGQGRGDVRAVFAVDPESRETDPEPAFVLDLEAFSQEGLSDFKPSGMASHPVTGDLYVISTRDRAIAVVDGTGRLVEARALPESLYEQPEGIAFLPDGTLFISNEQGRTDSATLLRFDAE